MVTKTIDIRDQETDLKTLLSQVQEGTEIILVEGDKTLARLVPMAAPPGKRVAGLHPGAIRIGDDFDDPLPDEFWLGAAWR
jgi:antitoxin (DNA-binding transcriptional repressor) of toxin-antitoxin stability system